jgi:dephospho-CoA kinase
MRIGVAGLNASGKTEVVQILESRSFYGVSLSDVIREDLTRDGLEPTREQMIVRGRALRERFGSGILAERVIATLPPDRNHVIDSIRHPAEVEAFRQARDWVLVWVETSPETRYERLRARGRVGEEISFERFQELQQQELESPDPSAQQLLAVRELADEVIENEGTVEDLRATVQRVLEGRLFFRARPSWDLPASSRPVRTASSGTWVRWWSPIVDSSRPDTTEPPAGSATATRGAARAARRVPRREPGSTSACAATPRRTRSRSRPTTV